ncbi:MAG TPA: helix-turn-helix transcriptional regulator [Streptomyces sp.]
MTSTPGRKLICPNCQKEFYRQTGKPGRPRDYCSDSCRNQASRRKAAGEEPVPDPVRYDALQHEAVAELQRMVDALVEQTHDQHSTAADLLRFRPEIARLWEDYEALTVRRGRAAGERWEELGASLLLSPDRLRKKWTSDAIARRVDRRLAHTEPSPAPRMFIPQQRPSAPRPDDGAPDDSEPEPAAHEPTPVYEPSTIRSPEQLLASALSHLQRRNGGTLRELAHAINVDPSYVSRIMNGERRPSWRVTASLAASCLADPADLRPLWNIVHNRLPAPMTATAGEAAAHYRAFLRGLHLSAASPSTATICQASNNTLTTAAVTTALHGPAVPDWLTTSRLVIALQGRPSDIQPLWHAAHTLPTVRASTISAGALG